MRGCSLSLCQERLRGRAYSWLQEQIAAAISLATFPPENWTRLIGSLQHDATPSAVDADDAKGACDNRAADDLRVYFIALKQNKLSIRR